MESFINEVGSGDPWAVGVAAIFAAVIVYNVVCWVIDGFAKAVGHGYTMGKLEAQREHSELLSKARPFGRPSAREDYGDGSEPPPRKDKPIGSQPGQGIMP